MKIVLAIISDSDHEAVSRGLITAGFRVTRVASTGGFLRRGSSTLMIGLDDARVDEAIETIRGSLPPPSDPSGYRATIFVIPVDDYTQI
jgi:uncharacterized protein YaaQ